MASSSPVKQILSAAGLLAALVGLLFLITTFTEIEVPGEKQPLTMEQIDYLREHVRDLRSGSSRGEMWNQLRPWINTAELELVDDGGSARHSTQTYQLGHGYLLRLMFDPANDSTFRRAEVFKR
jgi:hypothetical protein